jgi:hypothetical protein
MAANHLEQLVAEWYEYCGYFVRRNVHVGPLPKGGFECELDVVGLHPTEKKLIHVESSVGGDSWQKREQRYKKKFEAGKKYIPQLFHGLDVPVEIDQIALFLFARKTNRQTIGGGRIMTVSELLAVIVDNLKDKAIARQAVPETFPLVRMIQFVAEFRGQLFGPK